MKVAILFDGASAFAAAPDLLIIGTVEAIEHSLVAEGNTVVRVPVHPDGSWIERLRRDRFDLAFNMCEGIDGMAELEPAVIAILELFGIPHTGSSSHTTSLCLRKHIVNALLEKAGLPIPPYSVLRKGAPLPIVGFPAICKPAAEDASLGVSQKSVVRNTRALAERVAEMLECWDELLVQRYIEGREVNVGVLGDVVLPIAEIDFGGMPQGRWHIVTYQSKWATGSVDDLGAMPRCPASLPTEMADRVRSIALAAWKLVGGEGYGRVDMRIDEQGQPWILEVNANPDIAPDAGLARMARVAGIEYSPLIRRICELALSRTRGRSHAEERWKTVQELSGVTMESGSQLLPGQGE